MKKKTVVIVNAVAIFIVVFSLFIVNYVPQSKRDKSSIEFIDKYIYSNFDLHIADFERIKDIIVEVEKGGSCWYHVHGSKGTSPAELSFKKAGDYNVDTKYTEINLLPEEQQSIDAICQGVKASLDIAAWEYGVCFLYGVCEGGFVYTENIEKLKETVNLDAMRFVHIKDNWYGIIYTIR